MFRINISYLLGYIIITSSIIIYQQNFIYNIPNFMIIFFLLLSCFFFYKFYKIINKRNRIKYFTFDVCSIICLLTLSYLIPKKIGLLFNLIMILFLFIIFKIRHNILSFDK